jgi:hypothetical protein
MWNQVQTSITARDGLCGGGFKAGSLIRRDCDMIDSLEDIGICNHTIKQCLLVASIIFHLYNVDCNLYEDSGISL